MFHGHCTCTDQGHVTNEGAAGGKTRSHHSGLCTGIQCRTLRDVHFACESYGCISDRSGYGSPYSTALCSGSCRYVDPHKAESTDRREALSGTGLQAGLCLCGSDLRNTSGSDQDECELILLGITKSKKGKKKDGRLFITWGLC